MNKRFSVSRVNLYLQNPFKHWAKYVAGYKVKEGVDNTQYMDRGTVFHKVMEELGKGTETAEAFEIASKLPYEEKAIQSGLTSAERYVNEYGTDGFKSVTETEKEITMDLYDDVTFIGYIDAVRDNGDGTVTLVDYKTYSTKPTEDKMVMSLQANIYMYVMDKLGYKVAGFEFDCVNPKDKIVGRAYKFHKFKFRYNKSVCDEMYEQFVTLTKMIVANPDFKLYVPGDYMPDAYDMLYKVWMGYVTEDLDEFTERTFEVDEEDE